jgi:hypothetical protein
MRRFTIALALTGMLLVSGCAAPTTQRRPSQENLQERVALTARLVEIQEQHLAHVKAQYENGVAPQSDVSGAEIALIDAKLRHLSARALVEMHE